MNKRLQLICEYIENGKGVADVGTDHGYLPIYLASHGYEGNIIASDINEDPLNKAIKNAELAGLGDKIRFCLCDGLGMCPPEDVDTIVVAGMGGDMIVKILDEGYWCLDSKYKLILQPMSKAEVLRYWLVYNEFEIKAERLVEENGSIYQIIVAVFGGKCRHNDAELFSGKREFCPDAELYEKQLQLLKKRFTRAVNEMSSGEDVPRYRLKLYEEILEQLEESNY